MNHPPRPLTLSSGVECQLTETTDLLHCPRVAMTPISVCGHVQRTHRINPNKCKTRTFLCFFCFANLPKSLLLYFFSYLLSLTSGLCSPKQIMFSLIGHLWRWQWVSKHFHYSLPPPRVVLSSSPGRPFLTGMTAMTAQWLVMVGSYNPQICSNTSVQWEAVRVIHLLVTLQITDQTNQMNAFQSREVFIKMVEQWYSIYHGSNQWVINQMDWSVYVTIHKVVEYKVDLTELHYDVFFSFYIILIKAYIFQASFYSLLMRLLLDATIFK